MTHSHVQSSDGDSIEYQIDSWKHEHRKICSLFCDQSKDSADSLLRLLILKYLIACILKETDSLTEVDKNILEIFATLDLAEVLMETKTVEEKLTALAKWQNNVLEIVGNNPIEILRIGRIYGDTKVRINENHKIHAFLHREVILKEGRAKGSIAQKIHAQKTKEFIQKINSDLLKHPETARWTLDKRANYIEKKLIENNKKQINGKSYKVSTIKLFITGKE